jgi:hypothetical protein
LGAKSDRPPAAKFKLRHDGREARRGTRLLYPLSFHLPSSLRLQNTHTFGLRCPLDRETAPSKAGPTIGGPVFDLSLSPRWGPE